MTCIAACIAYASSTEIADKTGGFIIVPPPEKPSRPNSARFPEKLLDAHWQAVDSLDADIVASQFAEWGTVQLADHPPVVGRRAIRRAFVHLFTEIGLCRHTLVSVWSCDGLIVAEADVTFILEKGGAVTLPMTTVLWTTESNILASRLLLYPEPALVRATLGFTIGGTGRRLR